MPGTPPTTPVHGAPRVSNSDTFDMARDVNGVADRFDITAMRLDTGLASARPGTGPGTGAWYYATDTRTLSRWNGSAWETNLPNAHAATHQDGGTDPLTVREAMMATGALGLNKGRFAAYRNAALSRSTGQIIAFDTEERDLSNWFDTTTNVGRFTPQLAAGFRLYALVTATPGTGTYIQAGIRKNGVDHKYGQVSYQNGAAGVSALVACEVEANGTTDYFEVVFFTSAAGSIALGVGATSCYFQGSLIGRS